jgi:hypothetical protein
MKRYPPVNPKQAALIILAAVILWVPMSLFIAYAIRTNMPERRFAAVAAINLPVGVGLLIFIYRRWISKVK